MAAVAAHGLAVRLPPGWEARIARRASGGSGARSFPVLHAGTFPLPEQRDDFGGGVTHRMRSTDAFVVLFEYGPDAVGRPLFAKSGVPRVRAELFGTQRLQRPLPGQLGCQQFFTHAGRAFCLYVVAGSRAALPGIITRVNALLDDVDVL